MPDNVLDRLPVPPGLRPLATAVIWRHLTRAYSRAGIVTSPTPRAAELQSRMGAAGLGIVDEHGLDHTLDAFERCYRQLSGQAGITPSGVTPSGVAMPGVTPRQGARTAD